MIRLKESTRWIIVGSIIAVGVAILNHSHFQPTPEPSSVKPVDIMGKKDSPDIIKNSRAIFQKAFWRHPGEDDEIVNAERREWSDETGITRWQWFIQIRPGPAMKDWLATNPFGLHPTERLEIQQGNESVPEWFHPSAADAEILQKTGGSLTMVFSADRSTLYATDAGHGFEVSHTE